LQRDQMDRLTKNLVELAENHSGLELTVLYLCHKTERLEEAVQRNILLREGLETTQGGNEAGATQPAAIDNSSNSIHGSRGEEKLTSPPLFRMHDSDSPTGRGKGQRTHPDDVSQAGVRTDVAEIEAEQDTRIDSCPTRDPRRRVTLAVPLLLQEGDTAGARDPPQEAKGRLVRMGSPTLVCSSEEVDANPSGSVSVHGPVVAGAVVRGALRGHPHTPYGWHNFWYHTHGDQDLLRCRGEAYRNRW